MECYLKIQHTLNPSNQLEKLECANKFANGKINKIQIFYYLKICSICLIFRYSVPGLPEKECEQDRNENVVHTNFHAVILNLSVDNIT